MKKLGVLGCGNMAQALVLGMYNNNVDFSYHTFTPSHVKAKTLAAEVGGIAYNELSNIPKCDFYMIACKPQQFEELAKELKPLINKSSVIISIMAGVTTEKIGKLLGVNSVVRIMPNTPSLVGHGVNALFFSSVENSSIDLVTKAFRSFSKTYVFDKEDDIDIITGFSGSGPAYIFEFSRIMTNKMMSMGIDKKTASEMVNHTFLGASKLLAESDDDAETLRNNVTSKKGVTYEALEVFKKFHFEEAFDQALDAAYNRSKELSK